MAWLPGVVLLVAVGLGCGRDADSVRAELAAREDSWGRRLSTFKSEQASLKARVHRQIGEMDDRVPGADLRLLTAVNGLTQSLIDVESQLRQVRPRVEHAARDSAKAGQKALDDASAQMNGYFGALLADLAAANGTLASTNGGTTKSSVTGLANGSASGSGG